MIVLRPTNLHWIDGSIDDPTDLCAHSSVDFRIGDSSLVKPSDGDWTVSATALYLLRTLSRPRSKHQPIAEFLFPCCGNGIFEVEGQEEVLIIGCNFGIDFEVAQIDSEVFLTEENGTQHRIPMAAWKTAVCQFSDAVQEFYAGSSPRQPEDDADRASFRKFASEWSRRRRMVDSGNNAECG